MPIVSYSIANSAKNFRSKMVEPSPDQRSRAQFACALYLTVHRNLSSTLDNLIMAVGCYLARKIEEASDQLGFTLPVIEAETCHDQRFGFPTEHVLNKYSVAILRPYHETQCASRRAVDIDSPLQAANQLIEFADAKAPQGRAEA